MGLRASMVLADWLELNSMWVAPQQAQNKKSQKLNKLKKNVKQKMFHFRVDRQSSRYKLRLWHHLLFRSLTSMILMNGMAMHSSMK